MSRHVFVHCVRHAQGYHNVGNECYTIRDPSLTGLGEQQCHAVRDQEYPDQSMINLVVASPMMRTLHTAQLAFEPFLSTTKSRIIALPHAQEITDYDCDRGRNVEMLEAYIESQGWSVDLTLVEEGWNVKSSESQYSPASEAVKARARETRLFLRVKAAELLRKMPEDQDVHLVLVSHGGFLHFLTNDWEDSAKNIGTGWNNCESRVYVFANTGQDLVEDTEAFLVETIESRKRRGKGDPMIAHSQQMELFLATMAAWEKQGLQNPLTL